MLCCVALVYNSYFFLEQPFYRNYPSLDSHTNTANFSRGCLTRQDGFQNHDKVYFATNWLLRCFLFIDSFILHGLIVGDRDKMSKLFPSTGKICSSTLIRREALGTSSASDSKKMAENFTLFAIEEEIPVQMPKNIELEEQKYNSTNDN